MVKGPRALNTDRIAKILGVESWLACEVWVPDGVNPAAHPWSRIADLTSSEIITLSTTRGRSSALDSTGPQSLALALASTVERRVGLSSTALNPVTIDAGYVVRPYLTDAALDVLFGHHDFTDYDERLAYADPRYRFCGSVTDVGDFTVPVQDKPTTVPLIATSFLAKMSGVQLAVPVVPDGTYGEVEVAVRAGEALWGGDKTIRIGHWADDAPFPDFNYVRRMTEKYPFQDYPLKIKGTIDPASASDIFGLLTALGMLGTLIERRNGQPDIITAAWRLAKAPVLSLSSNDILVSPTAGRHMADVTTSVEVTYGAALVTNVASPAMQAAQGMYPKQTTTPLAYLADATALGNGVLQHFAQPRWQLGTVRVDLTALLENDRLPLVRQLLAMDLGDSIMLTDMPDYPDWSLVFYDGRWAVEGINESISAGRWYLDLALVPFDVVAPPL